MVTGYVQVFTDWEHAEDVYRGLLDIEEVKDVHPMFGEPDLLVRLEASGFHLLGHCLATKIRALPGIVETRTLGGARPPHTYYHGKGGEWWRNKHQSS